jgi:hypothetical protein
LRGLGVSAVGAGLGELEHDPFPVFDMAAAIPNSSSSR